MYASTLVGGDWYLYSIKFNQCISTPLPAHKIGTLEAPQKPSCWWHTWNNRRAGCNWGILLMQYSSSLSSCMEGTSLPDTHQRGRCTPDCALPQSCCSTRKPEVHEKKTSMKAHPTCRRQWKQSQTPLPSGLVISLAANRGKCRCSNVPRRTDPCRPCQDCHG